MRRTLVRLLLASALTSPANLALAQENVTGADQMLPEVVAEGDAADDSYQMGTGADAGTTTITGKEIRARAPGSGDANELLKALPSVQFSRSQGLADADSIQDLRPAEISISGGRYYNNLISLDGIDANTRVDVTNDNPQHYQELAGPSAQSLWVDTNLIGKITLRDANISAEYGQFTGGVLDVKTRSPRREWGGSATLSYTSDALTNFKMSELSRAAYEENDELPDTTEFQKWRYGVTLDVPVHEDIGLLLAYNRSRADVTYYAGEAYGNTRREHSSVSDNFMAKMEADLSGDLQLSGQIVYTPYESESSASASVDNTVTSRGGGLAANLELKKSGETEWSLLGTFSHSDTGRDASEGLYSLPSFSTNGSFCSNSNCSIGGAGSLNQWQNAFDLKGRVARDIGPGHFSAGFQYQHIDAMKERPEDTYAYSRGTDEDEADSIVCAEADSLTCVTGEYALEQYSVYKAYRAEATIDSAAAWAQYDATLGDVILRGGLRYDYDSFLGNHTLAPRLSATYALPLDGWSFTLGANRYYGRATLAYALREQYPDSYIYRRSGTASGDSVVYSEDDWEIYRISRTSTYADDDKKSPYNDELTAILSGRALGGQVRLKGIYRDGKNEFNRSLGESLTGTLEDGTEDAYTQYVIDNSGWSKYRAVSLEWVRRFGKHSIALNAIYSKTKQSNTDYDEDADDLLESDPVLFEGEVIEKRALANRNQRADMAAPFIANLTWTGLWLDDRITTNLNLRFRSALDRIGDTGENETLDGTRYDVYDYIHYSGALDVNFNVQAEVIRSSYGVLTADVRASNLFNRTPIQELDDDDEPYQYGRSFWVGLNYRF